MLKVITGQRHQIESKLIEAVCLGELKKADELIECLKVRSNVSLVNSLKADQHKQIEDARE
jgi:hypothetical protein